MQKLDKIQEVKVAEQSIEVDPRSKTTADQSFNYIATGKPVVHFAEIETDPVGKIAEEFSNLFIIDKNTNVELLKANLINYFENISDFDVAQFNKLYSASSLVKKLNNIKD